MIACFMQVLIRLACASLSSSEESGYFALFNWLGTRSLALKSDSESLGDFSTRVHPSHPHSIRALGVTEADSPPVVSLWLYVHKQPGQRGMKLKG